MIKIINDRNKALYFATLADYFKTLPIRDKIKRGKFTPGNFPGVHIILPLLANCSDQYLNNNGIFCYLLGDKTSSAVCDLLIL